MKPAVRARMIAFSEKYFTGTPEQVRWRLHREAKKKLIRYGKGRWSALPPDKWEQAERELQGVLERRIAFGKPTPPEKMKHIIGGVITAIKIAGGRAHYPKHVKRHFMNVRCYSGVVMKRIAMGLIPPPKGMR